jgi:hypothetical protein
MPWGHMRTMELGKMPEKFEEHINTQMKPKNWNWVMTFVRLLKAAGTLVVTFALSTGRVLALFLKSLRVRVLQPMLNLIWVELFHRNPPLV